MALSHGVRRLAALAATCGLATLAGCGSGGAPTTTTTTTTTRPPGTATTLSCTQFTSAGPNCPTTAALAVGGRLVVVLASTFWHVALVGGTALAPEGPAKVRSSTGCVPGVGCGTVTATYAAVRAGTVEVVATRSVCGEAVRCTGANGRVVIRVTVH